MRIFVLSICMLLATLSVEAQRLESLAGQMAELHQHVGQAETDEERQAASDEMRALLLECFDEPGAFEYPFEEVFMMASITSPDGAFRLFSWHQPKTDDTHKYYAFLLFPKKGKYTELEDAAYLGHADLNRVFKGDEWYGALYYEIFPVKLKKETVYTVMGWDGNNRLSNKKVLDVMCIDKKGKVTFGRPLYQMEDTWVNRRVFEYAENVTMTLRFIENKDAIIFDQLVPSQLGMEGQYAFYGPGTEHDAYRLGRNGNWQFIENIDMSRPKDKSGAQFNFPPKVDPTKKRSEVNPLTGK